MPAFEIAARNPFLVLVWSFGLFMLVHLHQYIGALLAAWRTGQTFDVIMGGKYEDHTTILLRGLGALAIGVPLTWIASTALWRRPLDWMQLPFRGGLFLAGIGLGVVLPILIVLVLRVLGQATIARPWGATRGRERLASFVGIACMALFTGVAEEVIFRAMAARELSLVIGWPLAVFIAGAYVGAVHLVGQIKTLTVRTGLTIMVSSIFVSFLFVVMYVRGGSLWMPIGFHAAWNFSLVGVLGLLMSGKETEYGLLKTTLKGSPWLTGGQTGMEASAVALVAYAAIGLLFMLF